MSLSCVLAYATWVGGVELVEGLAPSGDLLALDHAGGLVGPPAGLLAAGGPLAGSLVLDVDDGEPEQLDDGVVGREVAAGLGDLAELVVQRLDAVGGVEQPADARGEGEERGELLPGVLPDPAGLRVLPPPGRGGEGREGVEGGLGRGRGVDLPQLPGDLGGVAARDRPQAVADQVDLMPTSA